MRTFVALSAPPTGGTRRFLEACQAALMHGRPDVKWVAPENFHVTLRFLGDVPEDRLPDVGAAVRGAAAGVEPFDVRLAGWGAFPNASRPQTLWAAVAEGAEPLKALERALTERLEATGFPPERKPFHPHITLGRARSPGGVAMKDNLRADAPPAEDAAFTARGITLYESRLTPSGPIYRALLEAPFGG